MSAGAGGWNAISASVRGASHQRSGKPNQDSVRVLVVDGATPGVVAAVCDGHGGDRYVRSDVGSRLASEEACSVGRRALEALGADASRTAIDAMLRTEVTSSIVERWRKRVQHDVEQRPFTDDERNRAADPLDGDPLIAYGCTLLLGLFARTWTGFVQIGDGDVTIVSGSTAGAPVPGDARLVGGETTSLCLPTATADARVAVVGEPLPDLVLLTSDGYANSFASPTWQAETGLDLRRHVDRLGIDGVEAQLATWLNDSAVAAGDDVSMALIHRTASQPSASATAGAAALPATAATPRSSRRLGLVAIVGAAACIGGGIGWLVGGSAGDGDVDATAATNVTATTAPTSTSEATLPTRPVPSTTSTAPTSVAPDVPPQLTPQDQVVVFIGAETSTGGPAERAGMIVAFDPSSPTAADARSFGSVTVVDSTPALPERWRVSEGEIYFDETPVGSAFATFHTDGPYVWAIDREGAVLSAYYTASGALAGQSPITSSDAAVDAPSVSVAPGSEPDGTSNAPSSIPTTSETTKE